MIPAFNTRNISPEIEAMIGKAMLKMEKGKKWHKDASNTRPHGSIKNMGSTKQKYTWLQEEWEKRAERVRAYLEKNPGARTTDLADGIGVEMRTMSDWCCKFRRMSSENFGIKFVMMGDKKYRYWRMEDTPKFGDAK